MNPGYIVYKSPYTHQSLVAQQTPAAFNAFRTLLQEYQPGIVLEIGTSFGGLTQFLRDTLNDLNMQETRLVSFDIQEYEWHDSLRQSGIELIQDNIFSTCYQHIENPNLIIPLIQNHPKVLLLCDGGNKINEFRLLAPFLKADDVIMAHDYIDTPDNFDHHYMGKIWDWREIGAEHIDPVCQQYGLVPFMQEKFNNAVWACRKK